MNGIQQVKKWMISSICILIGLSLIGCTQLNPQTNKLLGVSNTLAEVEITSLTYAGPNQPSGFDNIEFDINITPKNITYNQKYFIALISQDNYLYSYNSIMPWTQEDFTTTNNTDRQLRNVVLEAPSTDKDISPIIQSYLKLQQQRHPNSITKADYQNICKNHVYVIIVDENTLQSLINQQSPTSLTTSATILTTPTTTRTLSPGVFTTPPPPSFAISVVNMQPTGPISFNIQITELNRQNKPSNNPSGGYWPVSAKIACISIQTGKVLSELSPISWGQYTTAMQESGMQAGISSPYDASILNAIEEYHTLQATKETSLAAARAQAEKDFLAGKPYVDIQPTDIGPDGEPYIITNFESATIANKYFKFIVGPYIK